jgi:hypothetical protein
VELFLNIAGALAGLALIGLWLRCARSARARGANRTTQLVALILLILIIFPVISVTDDLLAVANPAETDVLSRRDHQFFSGLAAIPAALCPGESLIAEPDDTHGRLIASLEIQVSSPDPPALSPIENRPPPAL